MARHRGYFGIRNTLNHRFFLSMNRPKLDDFQNGAVLLKGCAKLVSALLLLRDFAQRGRPPRK